ncbi:MAG: hypothetical protein CO143_02280 [Candidatus Moranbacteria bacterium CG_4_9_14_3_um_filter_45_14]|nr:MAG: hypothetical protein AUK19_03340 [Candidatus Moranbacteria bacterium CG2_30_45_14]PJA85236.1 MAG: hypothetical protein CO143_02280 [Candidatus Moranbacteria bacterium CG_4_9_14_3_um_filter_45_14]
MYKYKNFIMVFFIFFFSAGAFLFVSDASAAGLQYTLLEKIPGFTSTDGSDLPKYIIAIYKLALTVIVFSAVLMLSIGGFMYLTSAGNTSAMGTAKGVIFDAIIGLVIALIAWLLLSVINPDLVKVSINGLSAVAVPGGGPVPPPSPGAVPTGTTVDLAKQIAGLGVLQGSGECSSPSGAVSPKSDIQNIIDGKAMSVCSSTCKSKGSNGCKDNAVSANETMLRAIITVKSTIGYIITSIAGGAHSPTSDHYAGNALDIAPPTQALLDAFVTNGAKNDTGSLGGSFCESSAGKWVTCASGQADHIHIKF